MKMKTLAYLLFIALCLAGTAFLGFFGLGDATGTPRSGRLPRSAVSSVSGAGSVAAAGAPTTAPATKPAAAIAAMPAAQPQPAVKPPAVGSPEVWDAIWERLGAAIPSRMLLFPMLAEQRQLEPPPRRGAAVPSVLPPAELRRTSIEPRAVPLAAVLPPMVDVPPLMTARDNERPPHPALATGPKLKADESPAVPPPALRVALVQRPRTDTGTLRIDPILDERGGTAMPLLPVFRATPMAPMQPTADAEQADIVLAASAMAPDVDPPVAARTLVARPPLPVKPAK